MNLLRTCDRTTRLGQEPRLASSYVRGQQSDLLCVEMDKPISPISTTPNASGAHAFGKGWEGGQT